MNFMRVNLTRERLAKGETVYGCGLQVYRAPEIVRCFAAAGFGSNAGAQTEVKAKDRDAAIEKCIARAHREYPDPGEAEAIFRARAASYKACMAENGQAP